MPYFKSSFLQPLRIRELAPADLSPIHGFAVGIDDVEIDPGVWIGQLEFGYLAREFTGLFWSNSAVKKYEQK